MRLQNHRLLKSSRRRKDQSERGVALITTLLLLMLLTGLSLAMVFSVRSDMLINGNYRNFRGSFYAADSGLNAARTYLQDQIVAAIPASFGITTQPIPNGTDGTIQTNLNTQFGAAYKTYTQGQAASSWPGKYQVTGTFGLVSCSVLGGAGTCSAPTGPVTGYRYIYNYTLQSVGQAQSTQATTLTDRGSIIVNATLIPVNSTTSFAAWGMFIDQWSPCSGTLVPGTISGPAFTNGAWTFGATGSYIFTDTVGSANSDAGFQFSNACDQLNASSDKKGNQTIAPQFQAGFQTGQATVPLPTNDFNQKRAVLDGQGVNNTAVSNTDLHNALKNISGTAYPSAGASSGVYLPYTIVNGQPTFNGGGIYVEGNANVVLSTATGPAPGNSNQQVYTITQGTPAVTTTITVDPGANLTTVVSGGSTLPIQGIPHMTDPVTAATSPGTMLYVDGSINSLSGPGQGLPAINDGSALTITAAANVTVTGDILYKTEPVTMTQNQIPGQPADTLIPGNNNGQTLGIYTGTGDIQLNNKQANGNLEIDASLATISQGGTGGLVNVGSQINTLTIVGGRIQNQIKNIGTTTRNVFFDRRYSQNGFAPPWFPSTHLSLGAITSAHATTTVQRVQWLNQSSYF
jgi:Tfp pilus assembly protein PilX